MNAYVTDTHALIWHLTEDPHLSAKCKAIFAAADRGEAKVWIPSIVLVETVYLVEKARIPDSLFLRMLEIIDPPSVNYEVSPLDTKLIHWLLQIDRAIVPDLPDRVVAATALQRNVPLLSKDSRIARLSHVARIW